MSATLCLEARDLVCRYPRSEGDAVRLDRLELSAGTAGLVGINGAGKTTLLATLAGCRKPQGGQVLLDGVDLYSRRRREVLDRIGYMPQSLNLPGEFRVADAISYVGWLRGVPSATAAPRGSELLERVGLADRRRDRVRSLSGGMVRRLTLALALITDPDVILLDEPTTGLDPQQRVILREMLAALPAGAVTLLSSHVMEDIERTADRIAVLHEGCLAYDGGLEAFVDEHGGPDKSAELAFLATVTRSRA